MRYDERFLWTAAVCGVLTMATNVIAAEPVLRSGDRVVFLGDSITAGQTYTHLFMNFVTMRQPGVDIAFVRNAGVNGDTAPGGLNRLEKDVLAFKPNVVMICYGMNNGRPTPPPGKTVDDVFLDAMSKLVATLKAANVRVVLLTPGCIDTDNAARWFPPDKALMMQYNGTLARLAGVVKSLAAREHLPVADMFTPMMEVTAKGKAADPKFTIIPDGVHPTEPGGAVMAYALAADLGYQGPASSLHLDTQRQLVAAERCQVKSLRITADAVSFVRVDEALPAFLEPEAQPLVDYLPILRELHAYRLSLTGLPAAARGGWKSVARPRRRPPTSLPLRLEFRAATSPPMPAWGLSAPRNSRRG